VPEVQTISFGAGSAFTARELRKTKQAIYPKLAPVALDILVAPASQAYVERLFSVCGLLCSGRRNRMTRSLTVRVCLKMNMGILCSLGVLWLTVKKKWMQNAYHNPDTSDWLSLTNPTLAYEWCVLIRLPTGQGKLEKVREFEWSGKVRESQGKCKSDWKVKEILGKILLFLVQLL